MVKINSVRAREIYDSRGNPTVEADVFLDDGSFGRAAVPSGASTGLHEAVELRDADGRGVSGAVLNVNQEINENLTGKAPVQAEIDQILIDLDGTPDKSRLGANAVLAVSLALSKAAATSQKLELWEYYRTLSATVPDAFIMPVPLINVLNGGKHAAGSSDFQEYMLVPVGAETFTRALRMSVSVFISLKKIVGDMGFATTVGDEGGLAPALGSNEKPLQLLEQAVADAGLKIGEDISFALDAAASEVFRDGRYNLKSENRSFDTQGMIGLYTDWISKYPLISIEDGLEQDDWSGYKKLTEVLGSRVQLVGDDLFVTNVKRLQQGIDEHAANAILIKLNQIGTVTETVAAIDLARRNGYRAIISHRSGETEDTSIADFAVGLSTGQIKTGSLSRSERMAKYNQLLRIEEKLGNKAVYPGMGIFKV